jgi:hypothetical protein
MIPFDRIVVMNKIRTAKWVIGLSIIIIGIYALFFSGEKTEPLIQLKQQTAISDYVRLTIQPTVDPSAQSLSFKMSLESNQNAEFIQSDFQLISLVIDQDDVPYEAIQWDVQKSQDFLVQGDLVFQLPENLKAFSFQITGMDDFQFTWKVK